MSYTVLEAKLKEAVLAAENSGDFLTTDETGFILGEWLGERLYDFVDKKLIPKISKVISETERVDNRIVLRLQASRRRNEDTIVGSVCDLLIRINA
jgi:hypothetical protein